MRCCSGEQSTISRQCRAWLGKRLRAAYCGNPCRQLPASLSLPPPLSPLPIAAQLENIVCRVVYVPGPLDPVAHAIQPFIPHSRHGGVTAGGVRQGSGVTSTPAAAAAASPAVPARGGQERQQDGRPDSRSCKQTRCSPGMQGASASGASRDPGTRDGVLHLTPTSKNLNGYEGLVVLQGE